MGYYVNSFDVDIHVKNVPDDLIDELTVDGFDWEGFEGTNLIAIYAINGKWSYIEGDLLKLGPYVVEPGYAYFTGEDAEQFRIVYDNNTLSVYDSKVVYNEFPTVEERY